MCTPWIGRGVVSVIGLFSVLWLVSSVNGSSRPVDLYRPTTTLNASLTFFKISSIVLPSVMSSGSSLHVTVYTPSGCGSRLMLIVVVMSGEFIGL